MVAVCDDARLKPARVVKLESVPGGAESLTVAERALVSPIIAAVWKTSRLMDYDVRAISRNDPGGISMFHRVEQASDLLADRVLIRTRTRQRATKVLSTSCAASLKAC